MADAVLSKAEIGDLAAAEFIPDTVDGPPAKDGGNHVAVNVVNPYLARLHSDE